MNTSETQKIKFEISIETGLFFLLFILLVILMYLSKGSYTGGDTYNHYQIARFAFKHPHLLLDLWGKPVFTLLFAPFAQFDYDVAKLFNVFLGVAAAYISFLTIRKLEHKISITVIFFVLFSPVYFIMLNSVMTEILFSLCLVTIVYLLISEKINLASFIFSFLPFVRSEAFILIMLFGVYLLFRKKWLPIILLMSGFLFYSAIGSLFYYHDFFWVITKNPYPFQSDIYGHGSLTSFFKAYRFIWEIPQSLFLAAGIIILPFKLFLRGTANKKIIRQEIIFVLVPAVVFFMFHVVAWWQGIFSSDGEVRIIASIIPLTAIIANRGLNFCFSFFPDKIPLKKFLLTLVCLLLVYMPFRIFKMPLQMDKEQKLVYEASMFVKTNFPDNKAYYVDPLVSVVTGRDPYEMKLLQQWFSNSQHPDEGMNEGDLVIWEAHFCPNEGRAPLKNFLDSKKFSVKKYFKPEFPFKSLGGNDYEVYVLQKKLNAESAINKTIVYENGFDIKSVSGDSSNFNDKIKNSGNFSYQMDGDHIYSPGYDVKYDKIKNENPYKINVSGMIYCTDGNQLPDVTLVLSFDRNDKPYSYNTVDFMNTNSKINFWKELKISISVPKAIKDSDRIKAYVWYRGKKPIYIDDLKVELEKINIDK